MRNTKKRYKQIWTGWHTRIIYTQVLQVLWSCLPSLIHSCLLFLFYLAFLFGYLVTIKFIWLYILVLLFAFLVIKFITIKLISLKKKKLKEKSASIKINPYNHGLYQTVPWGPNQEGKDLKLKANFKPVDQQCSFLLLTVSSMQPCPRPSSSSTVA